MSMLRRFCLLLDEWRSVLPLWLSFLFISIPGFQFFPPGRWRGWREWGRALPTETSPEILDDHVERRHQEQRQDGRGGQSTDDDDSQRPGDEDARFTQAQRHRQQGEDRRDGRHQDRSQATTASLYNCGSG